MAADLKGLKKELQSFYENMQNYRKDIENYIAEMDKLSGEEKEKKGWKGLSEERRKNFDELFGLIESSGTERAAVLKALEELPSDPDATLDDLGVSTVFSEFMQKISDVNSLLEKVSGEIQNDGVTERFKALIESMQTITAEIYHHLEVNADPSPLKYDTDFEDKVRQRLADVQKKINSDIKTFNDELLLNFVGGEKATDEIKEYKEAVKNILNEELHNSEKDYSDVIEKIIEEQHRVAELGDLAKAVKQDTIDKFYVENLNEKTNQLIEVINFPYHNALRRIRKAAEKCMDRLILKNTGKDNAVQDEIKYLNSVFDRLGDHLVHEDYHKPVAYEKPDKAVVDKWYADFLNLLKKEGLNLESPLDRMRVCVASGQSIHDYNAAGNQSIDFYQNGDIRVETSQDTLNNIKNCEINTRPAFMKAKDAENFEGLSKFDVVNGDRKLSDIVVREDMLSDADKLALYRDYKNGLLYISNKDRMDIKFVVPDKDGNCVITESYNTIRSKCYKRVGELGQDVPDESAFPVYAKEHNLSEEMLKAIDDHARPVIMVPKEELNIMYQYSGVHRAEGEDEKAVNQVKQAIANMKDVDRLIKIDILNPELLNSDEKFRQQMKYVVSEKAEPDRAELTEEEREIFDRNDQMNKLINNFQETFRSYEFIANQNGNKEISDDLKDIICKYLNAERDRITAGGKLRMTKAGVAHICAVKLAIDQIMKNPSGKQEELLNNEKALSEIVGKIEGREAFDAVAGMDSPALVKFGEAIFSDISFGNAPMENYKDIFEKYDKLLKEKTTIRGSSDIYRAVQAQIKDYLEGADRMSFFEKRNFMKRTTLLIDKYLNGKTAHNLENSYTKSRYDALTALKEEILEISKVQEVFAKLAEEKVVSIREETSPLAQKDKDLRARQAARMLKEKGFSDRWYAEHVILSSKKEMSAQDLRKHVNWLKNTEEFKILNKNLNGRQYTPGEMDEAGQAMLDVIAARQSLQKLKPGTDAPDEILKALQKAQKLTISVSGQKDFTRELKTLWHTEFTKQVIRTGCELTAKGKVVARQEGAPVKAGEIQSQKSL